MKTIYKRRSIRKFKEDHISDDTINDIIKAGMNAPSAGNERPWHFLIIRKKESLEAITKIHPYSSMLTQVNAAILVCGDLTLEKFKGFWVQDCSAAVQNMLLETSDMGLGSVWLALYPLEERVAGIRKILSLPAHIIPLAIVPVGVPDEDKPANDEFDQTRIHREVW